VIREVSRSAVVIVAVTKSANGFRLEQAGTGTLVIADGVHFILTAAHVWEEVLRRADKIGITIRTGRELPNEFLMDVAAITPCALPKTGGWDEWGPDIILLRIPPFYVGTIQAFRSFYRLNGPAPTLTDTDHVEIWMLCGAPQALGEFAQTKAHLNARTFQVIEVARHNRDEFDYTDFLVHWSSSQISPNFGGVSGGGLWKVLVCAEPSTGKVDWVASLEGVAFYHVSTVGDHGVLRCHGPKSIERLLAHSRLIQ
jgi:hypothetical protein